MGSEELFAKVLPEFLESMQQCIERGIFESVDTDLKLIQKSLKEWSHVAPFTVKMMLKKVRFLMLTPQRERFAETFLSVLDSIEADCDTITLGE